MQYIKESFQIFQNQFNKIKDYKYNKYRSEANKILGDLYNKNINFQKTGKYIICEALWDNPHHWLRLSIFAPVLVNKLKANLIGLYEKNTSKEIIDTLNSFKLSKYIQIESKVSRKYLNQAFSISKEIKKPFDIINLKLPYDFPGQALYDSMLKAEMIGSLEINIKNICNYVAELISYLEEYQTKIDWDSISALILSHPVHFRFSTLTHQALRRGIPVYIMNYVNEFISLRKLESVQDWTNGCYEKPEFEVVNKLSEKKKNYLERIGKKYLEEVRSAKRGETLTINAFIKNKKESFNKDEFLLKHNLDIKKPTSVIMTNCWPDFPNLFPSNWYADYVEWLQKTLEIITKVDNCNWIIKPHPAEFKYGSKTKMVHFLKKIKNKNIIQWPENISSDKLLQIADVVITSHGSAGFEYPALGTASICTKKTHYSYWGFTNCCSDYLSYKNLLENIQTIKKPNKNQQKLAYIYISSFFCNATLNSDDYLFGMGSLSNKLWPTIENFINKNNEGIKKERLMMNRWLDSEIQSYNFFKSINYELWERS